MGKKPKHATKEPDYMPGQNIASDEVGGTITGFFWFNGQWCYTLAGLIAVDRDLPAPDPKRPGALRLGHAYIAEDRIKWFDNGMRWQSTEGNPNERKEI